MLGQEQLHYRITGDAKGFKGAINQSQKSLSGFQSQLKGVASSLKLVMTGALVAAGGQSVKLAKNFTKSMTQIKALVGVASDEVDAMGIAARKMAIGTGKSANEAAEALFFITSAGLRGSDAMDVLEASLKAASVGLGETKSVADLATSALNAYGTENLSAMEATDVLTASVREGKLEASELAQSMGSVLPIASNMGVQFHEVGAAFAAMSRTGTNAAEASTALNAILSGLLKPTQQAEQALGEMGLSSKGLKTQIKEEGLLSVLKTLKTEFDKNSDAAGRVFPNIRALKGVLDLVGAGAETNAKIFESLSESLGATDEAFALSKDASKTFDIEFAKLQDRLLTVGETLLPLVNNGLKALNLLLGGKTDTRSQIEIAEEKLGKLEQKVEDTTAALEYWQNKGLEGDDIQRFTDAVKEAEDKLQKQKYVVAALTEELQNLDKQTDNNTDSNNDNNTSVEELNTIYQTYKKTIKELGHQQRILGSDIDLVGESIKETEKSLIELLNVGQENTKAFDDLSKKLQELKNLQATNFAELFGEDEDIELDMSHIDEFVKQYDKNFAQKLAEINKEMSDDINNQTDEMLNNQVTKIFDSFKLQEEQAKQVAQNVMQVGAIVQQHLVAMSDGLINSLGLANEGIQGFIKNIIKILVQLGIQQLINAMVSKATSKIQVATQFSVAQAGAIASATNTAAMLPFGFALLPGMIAAATSQVGAAFGGLTAFAEGGIVTGPVMGLVGAAGSEAIIPLDRLPQLMQQSQGNQTGEFTLRGQDLILALERSGDFRSRITG